MAKFQVNVTAAGTKVVPRIKTLRLLADLGLADAKRLSDYLVDSVPCVLVAGVDQDVAEHAAGLLRDAGAEAMVEESSVASPMLLCPEANQRYRWSWLSGPTPA